MGACNCKNQETGEVQFTLEDKERQSQLLTKFYQFKVTKPQALDTLFSEDFKFWNLGPNGVPVCGYWEGPGGYIQNYTVDVITKKMEIYSQEVKETYCCRNVMISVVELTFSTRDPKSPWTKECFNMVSMQIFNFEGDKINRLYEIWADFPQDSIKLPWKMAAKYQVAKPAVLPTKSQVQANVEKMYKARKTKGHDGVKPFYDDTTYFFLYAPSFWNVSLASRGYAALKRIETVNLGKTFEILEEKNRVVYVEDNISFEIITARAKSLKEGCPFKGQEYTHTHLRQLFWDGAKVLKSLEIISALPLDTIPTPFTTSTTTTVSP